MLGGLVSIGVFRRAGWLVPVVPLEAAAAGCRPLIGIGAAARIATAFPRRLAAQVWISRRPRAAPRSVRRLGSIEVTRRWLAPAPRTLGDGFVLVLERWSGMPGSSSGGTRAGPAAARRSAGCGGGFSASTDRLCPLRVGGGRLVGVLQVGIRAQQRIKFREDAADEGLCTGGSGGRVLGRARRRGRQAQLPEIPSDQTDQQHAACGAQH